jgi:hypothetical protein
MPLLRDQELFPARPFLFLLFSSPSNQSYHTTERETASSAQLQVCLGPIVRLPSPFAFPLAIQLCAHPVLATTRAQPAVLGVKWMRRGGYPIDSSIQHAIERISLEEMNKVAFVTWNPVASD